MSTSSILMGEILGTFLLILLGDGVVANVVLAKTKGNNSGWIVISWAWGMAVFVGAYTAASISGAHLNPAVTLGLAITGATPWTQVPFYVIGQFVGAFLGAVVVWISYRDHFAATEDKAGKLAVFCTGPAIRNTVNNLITEIVGTFVLMIGILAIKGANMQAGTGAAVPINLGAVGILPVALLVLAIGLSLGGPTGYAINPARDLGPRIAHFVLPVSGKGDSDWAYSWIPVVGPLIGASLAALLYIALGRF